MEGNRLPLFAQRFSQLRGELSQAKYAEMLGLSRPTVALYETGQRIPDAATLLQIAKKLGVSADYLLGMTDNPSVEESAQAAGRYLGVGAEALEYLRTLLRFSAEHYDKAMEKVLLDSGFQSAMLSLLDYHQLLKLAEEARALGDETTGQAKLNEATLVEHYSIISRINDMLKSWLPDNTDGNKA